MVSKKTFVKTILLISSLFFIVSCSNFLNEQSDITGSDGDSSTPQEEPTVEEPTVAFYLDPIHGIDTNEGTEAAPVKTMEKALTLYDGLFTTIIWVMNTIDVYNGETIFKGSVDGKSLTLKRYLVHKSALINVEIGGILTLENIIIDGNKENVEANEALITVEDEKLILNTNTILQNNNNTISSGGAVYVSHTGKVTIKGGTITNNIATNGGGISVAIGGTVNLERGGIINISSNKKTDDKPNNIAYTNSLATSPISVSSDITSEIKIGLSPSSTDYRDMLVKADPGITIIANHFTRDSGDGVATLDNNLIVSPIDVYLDPTNGDDTNEGTEAAPVKTMNRAIALLGGVGIISDANTILVKNTIEVLAVTEWNYNSLTLKRNTGTNGVLIDVKGDATLTLENIIIDGDKDIVTTATAALINVSNASLALNAGAVLQNNNNTLDTDSSGGGLYVADGGTVTIKGGEITNNQSTAGTSYGSGGGVYVASGGTVTIDDGKITNNETSNAATSSTGGGLYVADGGRVTINKGEITGNKSTNKDSTSSTGGGLYVVNNGTVIINGGRINDNSVSGDITNTGGGLYIAGNGGVQLGKGLVINITNNVFEPSTPSNISFTNTKTTTPIEIISDIVDGTKIGLSPVMEVSGNKLAIGVNNAIYKASYFELDGNKTLIPVKSSNDLVIGAP